MTEYDDYIRGEWETFIDDSSREFALLDATADIDVRYVLDLGCGAGQELVPFVRREEVFGVASDLAETCGRVAREKYSSLLPQARIAFLRARAEDLPFKSQIFDVVICRLVLPYTHNSRALAETSRVLRHGGKLILKIHTVCWYLYKLRWALKSGDIKSVVHACRVILAGVIYHISGAQLLWSFPSRETFQSGWLLRLELMRSGLRVVREMPDSNPRTPSFLIVKT